MQVIGLCRFSYPAIGGFQIEHETVKDRMAYLYNETRMQERFRLFEALTLPALRAQTDPRFDFIILIGDTLPSQHETRLRALTADMPQVRIVAKPPMKHRPLVTDLFQAARKDPSKPCLQFRLDDDDAVAIDFIEELRRAAKACNGFMNQHEAVAIDFNSGFLLQPSPNGPLVAEIQRPYLTAALGVRIAGDSHMCAMTSSHNVIYKNMPTVTLNKRGMYVRSYNQFNDSHPKHPPRDKLEPITNQQRGFLRSCFLIDGPELDKICQNDFEKGNQCKL